MFFDSNVPEMEEYQICAMWDSDLPSQSAALGSSLWSLQENKLFENALAEYDQETPDRWEKVAAMLPGKTVFEVERHYKDLVDDVQIIEEGLIAPPSYTNSSCSIEWMLEKSGHLRSKHCGSGGKGQSGGKSAEQERKKGVPWTEEEHRLFLLGLHRYGKGDWRSISRNFVVSRTPTQVASHAQKYFIRLHSGNKDKRRSSIHDITTVNGLDRGSFSSQQPATLSRQASSSSFGTDSNQSIILTYPQLACSQLISSPQSQAECNSLVFSHYPLGLYQQKGLVSHATGTLMPDSSFTVSQLGYPTQSAMHY
eukprot:TRINITY_DN13058_c0_g1_i2.p1 TRINITY_DN13058_c0_g1~~TRINITY_DN13058_c0_g1_i2.p1  ORF type:complete len:310 (+),score=41.73 TRINITY_DN13058_c0_g1_i2:53-982(+)